MLKKLFSRDAIAQGAELVGAAAVAFGVGLVSLPAGVIVGGLFVLGWGLLVFDTGGSA